MKTGPQGRIVSWSSVAGVALMAILVAVGSGFDSPPNPTNTPASSAQTSLEGFAGYDEILPLSEIATSFTVPSVVAPPPKHSFGTASTWIGAQNTAGTFIQLGVTEFVSWGPSGSHPILQFNAFWSSTALDFHPESFEKVSAGDLITVRMSLQRSGWILKFSDSTSGYSHTIDSHYGAGQSFAAAEWIQEDPISSANLLQNLPYPSLSEVRFSALEVDGRPPDLVEDDGRAMDVPGGPWLVPTNFESDAFEVIPATGYEKQYLVDVGSYNLAIEKFGIAVLGGKPGTHNSAVSDTTRSLLRALGGFEQELSNQSWPSRDEDDVRTLLIQSYDTSTDLRVLESGPTAEIEAKVFTDETLGEEAAEHLRADLGLPPPP